MKPKQVIKEEKTEKKFIQCSLEVSFQGIRGILKNTKIQTKLFYYKHSKVWTLSKLVYAFTLRYSLASRAFPKAIISVVCTELPVGLKFHFSQWKINFSQFLFIDKYLRSKEIEYFIHYIKFEMWLVLFYVNSFFLSTVELKLGHSIFQFILRFKMEIFECGS